jgi:hypothetical protein
MHLKCWRFYLRVLSMKLGLDIASAVFAFGAVLGSRLKAKALTCDEARRIAAGIARLPELMAGSASSDRRGER